MPNKQIRNIFFCFLSFRLLCTFACCEDNPSAFCGPIHKQLAYHDKPQPVVWGEPYRVPELKLRITWRKTAEPLIKANVIVRYSYRWFEYPYPEHSNGVWSDAFDFYDCETNEQGVVVVPEYVVHPRGWYEGKFRKGRNPEFVELEISESTRTHDATVFMTRKEIEAVREKHNSKKIVLSRPDKYEDDVKIEIIP